MNKTKNKRTTIGQLAITRYPDKIPVIIYYQNIILPNNITYENLLIKNDQTIGNLAVNIRQKIKLNYSETIDISFDDNILNTSEMVSTLYIKYKNLMDECLHLKISKRSNIKSNT